MKHRIYKWEIALICGVLVSLIWGAVTVRSQQELVDQVIRIHVLAHSDDPEDQREKLDVRDAVLEVVRGCSEQARSAEELEVLLKQRLPELEQAGERVLREQGSAHRVSAQLSRCWFPTRDYGTFSFPAGRYTALRLMIGEGAGKNWWCVAFPPLCVGASAQTVEEAVQAGYFTQEQGDLITRSGERYVVRFKSLELLGAIQRWVYGN